MSCNVNTFNSEIETLAEFVMLIYLILKSKYWLNLQYF